jgi:hypothetical protein
MAPTRGNSRQTVAEPRPQDIGAARTDSLQLGGSYLLAKSVRSNSYTPRRACASYGKTALLRLLPGTEELG